MPPVSFYGEEIDKYSRQLQVLQRKILLIAFLRMALFVLMGICIYASIKGSNYLYAICAIALAIAFIVVVKWNFRLNDHKLLLKKLIFVNTNELNVIENRRNWFKDGHEFHSDEGFTNDIDVFGDRSLFHLLNRTTTSHGSNKLADVLRFPSVIKPDIEEMQHAVRQLSIQPQARQLLTAYGLLNEEKEGNLHQIGEWLLTPNLMHNTGWVKPMKWVIPFFNIAALLYYLSSDNYLPLLMTIAISWICISRFIKYISVQQMVLGKKQAILDQYASILKIFSDIDTAQSGLLKSLRQDAEKAHGSIKNLSKLSAMLDQRLNLVVNIFLNSLLVYDLQVMYSLESWKLENKSFFARWIECVGTIESLNSLSTYASNNPEFCYPLLEVTGLRISATSLAHPLIPGSERVPNDIHLAEPNKLVVVTGSNMSGKTTFLRTIGINLLLAQCGAPVCANSFTFTPMHLLTAIRISDSLQAHTSYFMAELKRLQHIITFLRTGQPALVLVDEILRGTNSDDKSHGSEEFIKKIISFNCLTLFATHDLSLSGIEDEFPGVVSNKCFESTIVNDELSFDYQLRPGIAKNKNASFLMKKMEII